MLCLPQVMAGFRKIHPEVTLELISEFGPSDLSRREADVALRITREPPDSNLGRYICDFAICVYAAPQYVETCGARAMVDQDWVVFQPTSSWLVPLIFPNEQVQKSKTVISTNSVFSALAAAREGMGALAISAFLADPDPGLVRVAGPFPEMTMELWALMHPDLRNTARVTVFVDYLARQLRRDKALFEGTGGPG